MQISFVGDVGDNTLENTIGGSVAREEVGRVGDEERFE